MRVAAVSCATRYLYTSRQTTRRPTLLRSYSSATKSPRIPVSEVMSHLYIYISAHPHSYTNPHPRALSHTPQHPHPHQATMRVAAVSCAARYLYTSRQTTRRPTLLRSYSSATKSPRIPVSEVMSHLYIYISAHPHSYTNPHPRALSHTPQHPHPHQATMRVAAVSCAARYLYTTRQTTRRPTLLRSYPSATSPPIPVSELMPP